jgi:hypothetical protein
MIDLGDIMHYLIGLIIVSLFLYCIIKLHNYFSKYNIPIVPSVQPNKLTAPK